MPSQRVNDFVEKVRLINDFTSPFPIFEALNEFTTSMHEDSLSLQEQLLEAKDARDIMYRLGDEEDSGAFKSMSGALSNWIYTRSF